MEIIYRRLEVEDIGEAFLETFNRYQDVKKCWRKENNEWVLKDISFVEQWGIQEKREVTQSLIQTILEGGAVFGAYENESLVGFASVEGILIGSKKQYAVLHQLHATYEHRGQGIGTKLFAKSCEFARSIGAKKLYISAHSSEESQKFYRGTGCSDAQEIDQKLYALEPCDCHLEFEL